MKLFTRFFFPVLLFALCYATAQISDKDTLLLKKHIEFLCNDSLAGRDAGSEGEMIAVQYVEDVFTFQKINYFFQDGFSESFIFINYAGEIQMSRNVAGIINHDADSTIIIMAHLDHLGLGGVKSKSYTMSKIHYGADDNASGVSLLLLISKYLKDKQFSAYNFLLLGTGAHEPGFFGAGSFIRKYGKKLDKVKLVVNLDMVGRQQKPEVIYALTNEKARKMFEQSPIHISVMTHKVTVAELEEGDHTPFDRAGFPVIHITTGMHDDYHKVSDTPDKINYQGMINIMNFILDLLKI